MECEACGEHKDSVRLRLDPWHKLAWNHDAEWRLCDTCEQERRCDGVEVRASKGETLKRCAKYIPPEYPWVRARLEQIASDIWWEEHR